MTARGRAYHQWAVAHVEVSETPEPPVGYADIREGVTGLGMRFLLLPRTYPWHIRAMPDRPISELTDKLKGMKSDEMIIFMPPSEREFLYTAPTDGSTPKRLTDKDIAALKPGDKIQINRYPRVVFPDGTEKDFQGTHEFSEHLIVEVAEDYLVVKQ